MGSRAGRAAAKTAGEKRAKNHRRRASTRRKTAPQKGGLVRGAARLGKEMGHTARPGHLGAVRGCRGPMAAMARWRRWRDGAAAQSVFVRGAIRGQPRAA